MKRSVGINFLAIAMTLLCGVVRAQQANKPPILNDVGIDQKLGQQISPDITFRDETGATHRLGDYFGKRPIVLSLVYFKCPMLCTMVLNDLNRVMGAMKLSLGEQFDILTVSFDPTETSEMAAHKKKSYVQTYARPHAAEGWHFLTGDPDSIKKLTETVGFRYAWDDNVKQFAHASGIMILTPDGKISRYFYGVEYSARDLRLALDEADTGKISGPAEQILLYCFQYDPSTGRFSLAITRMLKVAAGLTVASIGTFWFMMHRRGKRGQVT